MTTPQRRPLPHRRANSVTHSASVANHTVIVTCGEYDDGSLGEIFINMSKEGSAFRSLMDCFAILVSLCLQHGVPLAFLIDRFKGAKFEPAGQVRGHADIKSASSIIDYVFQLLEHEYANKPIKEVPRVPEETVQDS